MTETGSAGMIGDLLVSRRRRRFVGRASEIELLWAALDSSGPPCSMFHLHRPEGAGTTRLLDGLAGPAADTSASMPDDLHAKGRPSDGIDLLDMLARF